MLPVRQGQCPGPIRQSKSLCSKLWKTENAHRYAVYFLIAVVTYPTQATSEKKWLILVYSFLRVMVYNGGGGMAAGGGGLRAGAEAGWTHYIRNPQTD